MRKLLFISIVFVFQLSYSQSIDEIYLKARSLYLNQSHDSSIIFFSKEIESNPGNTNAYYYRGLSYFELNNYDAALSDFLLVNKRIPGKTSLYLAKTEIRLNHQELAIKYLKELLNSSYKISQKDLMLDEDLMRLESSHAWKALWNEKEWYNPFDEKIQEVNYLISKKEYPEAVNILNELNQKRYKRTIVNQYLAEIYLAAGNKKAALEALTISVNSDPRNTESLKKRISYYISENEWALANSDCNKLLRLFPDEFEYYLISGQINSKMDNFEEAVEKINFFIKFYPNSPDAYNILGETHFEAGKYLNALSAFNKALDLNNGNAKYYYNRGLTYSRTKTYKFAERDFSMSLDLDPVNAETWFEKGLVGIELGKNSIACFDFKKALQYGKYESRDYINRLCK